MTTQSRNWTLKDERGDSFRKSDVTLRGGCRNTKSDQLEFAFPLCLGCLCRPFILMRAVPSLVVAFSPLNPIRPDEALLLCPLKTPIDALAINRAGHGDRCSSVSHFALILTLLSKMGRRVRVAIFKLKAK
jgi:hypothetical protein